MRIACLVMLGLAAACGSDASPNDAAPEDAGDGSVEASEPTTVEAAQALWESQRPERYVVKVCGTWTAKGCTVVAVEGDAVVSAATRAEADDHWQGVESVADVTSPVEQMFAQVRGNDACGRVGYDGTRGFVQSYSTGCEVRTGQKVQCFVANTVDLTKCEPRAVCGTACALTRCDGYDDCTPTADAGAPAESLGCFDLPSQGGGTFCMTDDDACRSECGDPECGILTSDPASFEC